MLISHNKRGRTFRGKTLTIYLSPATGFCSGVKRAIKMALEAATDSPGGVHSLGPLIHNPQAVERLEQMGVEPLRRVVRGRGVLVVRSHGASPLVLSKARRYGYEIVDATCPFVRRAQEQARRLHALGYRVVIVGERRHPEVKGIRGCIPGRSIVVENSEQAKRLKFGQRVGIIAQTTIPVDTFASVVSQIVRAAREVLVLNTICSETARRQARASKLAGEVDVLVVVGGRNSANTARLERLCRSIAAKTHQVETADEIRDRWFAKGSSVGVVTGTSTPGWLVDGVVNRLKKL